MVKGVCLLCLVIGLHPESGSSVHSDVSFNQRMAKEMSEGDHMWCQPQQVHISYGNSTTEVSVMWSTKGPCETGVHYAPHEWNLDLEAVGTHTELDQSFNATFRFIHRVVLKGLLPLQTYYFRPQVKAGTAAGPFYFKVPAVGNESGSSSFLVLGNMDSKKMLESVLSEAQSGKYSALLYGGDLEEILLSEVEQSDSEFLSDLEQAAGFVPLMTVPGKKVMTRNLDGLYLYRNTFSMPGTDWPMPSNKLWYSFDVGQVHFLVYSTDVLFEPDSKNFKAQRDWMVHDLQEANKKRSEMPWIIAIGSQPMYCSFGALDANDCFQNNSKVRHGVEEIFYFFAVDMVFEWHTAYERMWPKYKGVVITDSYLNPRATIEVIIGSSVGGQNVAAASDVNGTAPVTADWSAFHLAGPATNGYGRLTVDNSTHLYWEWISSTSRSTVDSFWIIQESHGDFNFSNLPHNISHQIKQRIIAMGGKPGTYDFISGSAGSASDGEGWSEYSLWLGLAVVGAILVIIIGMVAVRSCMRRRRRARAGRRWREVDRDNGAGGNFYSVASESDTDDNDFEIDVYDKTNKQSSKLLTSY
ncbi:hypothetical protein BsWGS_15577 [Bradybaena similaris]